MFCNVACESCTDLTNTSCLKCNTGYYLYALNNICDTKCPDGQYIDNIVSPKVCLLCT
jgi:hypothetical protein